MWDGRQHGVNLGKGKSNRHNIGLMERLKSIQHSRRIIWGWWKKKYEQDPYALKQCLFGEATECIKGVEDT